MSNKSKRQSVPQKSREIPLTSTVDSDLEPYAPILCHEVQGFNIPEILRTEPFFDDQNGSQNQRIEIRSVEDFEHMWEKPYFQLQNPEFDSKSPKSINQVEVCGYLNPFYQEQQSLQRIVRSIQAPQPQKKSLRINLDNIFQMENLKKHQNQPKHIIRLLRQNLPSFKKDRYFDGHEDLYARIMKAIKTCKDQSHSLQGVRKVLVHSTKNQEEQKLILLVMRKILSLKIRKQSGKKQVKNRLQYLVCLKVYSLRCNHSALVQRTEFK